MKNKRKARGTKKQERSAAVGDASQQKVGKEQQADDGNPFDFGGLPNRDLKKNLGCG